MTDRPKPGTTEPGFLNRNAQRVVRDTGLAGTRPGETAYVLECEQCQHRYAVNGSDIFEHRCRRCQSGKPGIPIDAGELLK